MTSCHPLAMPYACIAVLMLCVGHLFTINCSQTFMISNPVEDQTCLPQASCVFHCNVTNSCLGISIHLSVNATATVYCTGIAACNSMLIASSDPIQSLRLLLNAPNTFINSTVNVNLNGEILLECNANNTCIDSLVNAYTSPTEIWQSRLQMNCHENACKYLRINAETIGALNITSCESCSLVSPLLGSLHIASCLMNDSHVYRVQGVTNLTYPNVCNDSTLTMNLVCGLLYRHSCSLYMSAEAQYQCSNDADSICLMNDTQSIYNASRDALYFPTSSEQRIVCETNKDCYVYGQTSQSDKDKGLSVECPQNNNCSIVHCGEDCENIKLYANGTHTVHVNCVFLGEGNCRNAMISAHQCHSIHIDGNSMSMIEGDFSNSIINATDTSNGLFVSGNYNFDNLSMTLIDTRVDMECLTSCRSVAVYQHNEEVWQPFCDGTDQRVCDGFVIFHDSARNQGCQMYFQSEAKNESWECVPFNHSLPTTTAPSNSTSTTEDRRTKTRKSLDAIWIAVDSTAGVVSSVVFIGIVIVVIIYWRKRKNAKKRDMANYIALKETFKYYQD